MPGRFRFFIFLFLLYGKVKAQQVIFWTETFDNGTANWSLNAIPSSGGNIWAVNNVYTGINCLLGGFPLFTVPDVPAEPATVTGSPFSNYLHIKSTLQSGLCDPPFPPQNCNYYDLDNTDTYAEMTAPVSTIGRIGVQFSFYWLCNGSVANGGKAFFSVNSGVTWTQLGGAFSNQTTWTQAVFSNPTFDNQADLRFRFQWTNGAGGNDPAFAIDELTLSQCTLTQTSIINGATPVCSNGTGYGYNVNSHIGSVYNWTVIGGTIISGTGTNNINVNWSTSGIASVKVIEIGSCGNDSAILPVQIIPAPQTGNIIGAVSVCENVVNQSYLASPQSNMNFNWNVIGGSIAGVNGTSSVKINWGNSGTGNVQVQIFNQCDTVFSNLNVAITSAPALPGISGIDSLCSNSSNSSYSIPNHPGSAYMWSVTGGNVASGNSTNNLFVNWGNGSSGKVKVIESNTCGSDSSTLTVNLSDAPKISVITGQQTVCANTSGVTYMVINHAGSDYFWNVSGGIILGSTTNSSAIISWGSAGRGLLTAYETNSCGTDSAALGVSIISSAAAPLISGVDSACKNTRVVFNVSNSQNGISYLWQISSGIISGSNSKTSVTAQWAQNGMQQIKLIQTDACSTQSVNKQIFIKDAPVSSFYPLKNPVFINENPVIFSNQSSGAISYTWDLGNGKTSLDSEPQAYYLTAGDYEVALTAFNNEGCSDSSAETIHVLRDQLFCYVPNSFTPNNDGINDFFQPVFSYAPSGYTISVINRWGQSVFSSDNPFEGWNGKTKNGDVVTGVYVAFITYREANGTLSQRVEKISLLR